MSKVDSVNLGFWGTSGGKVRRRPKQIPTDFECCNPRLLREQEDRHVRSEISLGDPARAGPEVDAWSYVDVTCVKSLCLFLLGVETPDSPSRCCQGEWMCKRLAVGGQ